MKILYIALLLPMAACLPDNSSSENDGGGGDGGGDIILPPEISMLTSPSTISMNLAESADFLIEVNAKNYDGAVEMTVPNLPATWEVTFNPPITALADGDILSTTMTVSVPSNGKALEEVLSVELDAGDVALSNDASVSVADVVIIPLVADTGNGNHNFLSPNINLGTSIRFENFDSTEHRIHASNPDQGFAHEPDSMGPSQAPGEAGGSYDVTVTEAGAYQFYCHEHNNTQVTGIGTLTVESPAGE